MAFIAVLLALLIERYLGSLGGFRHYQWFDDYTTRLRQRFPLGDLWDGPLGVLAVLALPLIAVVMAADLLGGVAWFFELAFVVAILLYSFGPLNLEAEVDAYLDARERGDEAAARLHGEALLGEQRAESPGAERAMMETILVQGNERLLAVILWFVLLGPLGALLYRLTVLLQAQMGADDSGFAAAARRLHYLLQWLPARVAAFGFALSGSFVDAMSHWREDARKEPDEKRGVLLASGFGAMRLTAEANESATLDDVRETLALLRRTVVVALTVLALLTLAGWTG